MEFQWNFFGSLDHLWTNVTFNFFDFASKQQRMHQDFTGGGWPTELYVQRHAIKSMISLFYQKKLTE
jgi:hypothetical protein